MDFKNIFVLFGFIIFISCCESGDPSYTVELNSFEASSEYDTKWNLPIGCLPFSGAAVLIVDWNTLRMKKVSRNKFKVVGDFTVNLNLGNEQKFVMQVFKLDPSSKQRGPIVMNVDKPFCQFVSEDDTYPDMMKASNLPPQNECPFPKGEYTFDNFELETNFLPDDAPKGDYLIVVTLKDGGVAVSGFEAEVTLS